MRVAVLPHILFLVLAAGALPLTIGAQELITVTLEETPEAFPNPFKGFRPSRFPSEAGFRSHEYATVFKHYIAYSDLESRATDGVQKILDWSNRAWASLPARNAKVIPRVFILYPGVGEFWGDLPHDDTPSQWTTPALRDRLVAFVAKLGQAWDNDPRVAAIEIGLWGRWGEHNLDPPMDLPEDYQDALGEAFQKAFPHKKVMGRYGDSFRQFPLGFYWDSFALINDDNERGGKGIAARNTWQTEMQSGEVAYDWGFQGRLGGSPDGTLGSPKNTEYVIGYVRRMHTSSLGWISDYNSLDPKVALGAAQMQKVLGYRFVIQNASFSPRTEAGGSLQVSFETVNQGVAPLYYNWPVEVSLLKADRSPAWKAVFEGTDLTQWLPGVRQTVTGAFLLPATLAPGVYTLAVTVLDPASLTPSLRFANTAYYHGGGPPWGRLGLASLRVARTWTSSTSSRMTVRWAILRNDTAEGKRIGLLELGQKGIYQ